MRFCRFVLLLLPTAAVFSCARKPAVESAAIPITTRLRPYDVVANAGDRTARLLWKIDRLPDVPIHGYNIELADSPEGPWTPYLRFPYPGDTDGDISKETIDLENLTNGRKYFARVKTIIRDSLDSEPSAIVSFRPFEKGTLQISTDLNSTTAGFSFRKKLYLPAKDYDNDLYFYFNESRKGIASPSLLHPGLRRTLIARGEPESKGGRQFGLSQPLANGAAYTLMTADGATVKLLIKGITRTNGVNQVVVDYEFYPGPVGR